MAQATGLFALTRQLGGSIGIAALTTMLDRRIAVHRNELVTHLVDVDWRVSARVAALTQRFISQGFDVYTAGRKAIESLDGMVQKQTSILAFSDLMFISSSFSARCCRSYCCSKSRIRRSKCRWGTR